MAELSPESGWLIEATYAPVPLYYAGHRKQGDGRLTMHMVAEADKAVRYPDEWGAKYALAAMLGVKADNALWPLQVGGYRVAEHTFERAGTHNAAAHADAAQEPGNIVGVSVPEGVSRTDAQWWLEHRARIIDALANKGLQIVSDAKRLWIDPLAAGGAAAAGCAPMPAAGPAERIQQIKASLGVLRQEIRAGTYKPDPETLALAQEIARELPQAEYADLPPVHIDIERMRNALAGPRYRIPEGLTVQQTAAFMDAVATAHQQGLADALGQRVQCATCGRVVDSACSSEEEARENGCPVPAADAPDLRGVAHEMEVAIRFAENGLLPCAEELGDWKVALAELRRAAGMKDVAGG